MSDKTEERLSALMDNALSGYENDIDRLRESDSLKQRWMRYHLIRDTLSGHLPETPDFDLAARVSAALENEPVILAPRRFRPKQLMKQAAGLAIAAPVSAIAIISIQNPEPGRAPALASAGNGGAGNVLVFKPSPEKRLDVQFGTGSPPASVNVASAPARTYHSHPRQGVTAANPAKFNGYLVNHNEYSASSRMQGMLPYMRIVGATRNQPMVVRIANEQ